MRVHLLRAPDYEPPDYFQVCSLLKTLNLAGWRFIVPEVEIDPEEVYPNWGGSRALSAVRFGYKSPVEKIMYDQGRGFPLSWRELFDICRYYRNQKNVPATDVVILLTRRPNALNWFSAFDEEGNAFIHTADWERFMPCDPAFPIAYEVLANSLQMNMKLSLSKEEICVHKDPIGCMNDLCGNKAQIAIKLRTGDICTDCLERLQVAEVPGLIVESALTGFEGLRRQMLFRHGFRRSPGNLVVNRHWQLLFPAQGNLEVRMPTLARTLYLFFLRHPEGVRLAELIDHRAELWEIYSRISGSGNAQQMRESLNRLLDVTQNRLHENLSRIGSTFRTTLGPALAEPYLIKGEPGEVYRVNLNSFPLQWECELVV